LDILDENKMKINIGTALSGKKVNISLWEDVNTEQKGKK
jgi:hypothetical protein